MLYFGQSGLTPLGNEPMTFYNIMLNKTIEIREIPRLYSVTLWLIYVEEIFLYPNLTSNIGTYLYNTSNNP